jgi:hypothetical protein
VQVALASPKQISVTHLFILPVAAELGGTRKVASEEASHLRELEMVADQ